MVGDIIIGVITTEDIKHGLRDLRSEMIDLSNFEAPLQLKPWAIRDD